MPHARREVSLEIVEMDPFFDSNGWRNVICAVDGVCAAPLAFHRTQYDALKTESDLHGFLAEQASTMIANGLLLHNERQLEPSQQAA